MTRKSTRLRLPASRAKATDKKSAPANPGRSHLLGLKRLGSDLGVNHLGLGLTVADRNLARLLRLGNLAHEIDVQQAILEFRASDVDVIGKLEDALESACGDA